MNPAIITVTVFSVLILLNILGQISGSTEMKKIPKLLLISMDGMRYNFLDNLPAEKIGNFTFLLKNGVKAEYVKNVFPSVTYPSHMSIATGLYPESHGVVNNYFYDPYLEDTFRMQNIIQNFESKWFDVGAEPIWVTNHRSGAPRDSGVVMFPDAVAEIKSYLPRIIPFAFSNNVTYDFWKRVDYIVDWFDNRNGTNIRPINLGVLYFPVPDEYAHIYGAESPEVREQIYKLDTVLGYLKQRLIDANLFDEMNIIVTADHGHNDIFNNVKINLDDYVPQEKYTARVGVGTLVTFLEPTKATTGDELHQLLNKVPNIYVYRKGSQALKDLHLNNNRRIPEFVLEAKEGYIMGTTDSLKNFTLKSAHGYDPAKVKNMHPFFIAYGPNFKKGFLSKPFNMVDIYPLMCYILGIQPAPNNGSLENVKQILQNPPEPYDLAFKFTAVTFLVVVIFVALVGGIYSIGACRQGRIKKRKYVHVDVTRKVTKQSEALLNDNNEDDDDF